MSWSSGHPDIGGCLTLNLWVTGHMEGGNLSANNCTPTLTDYNHSRTDWSESVCVDERLLSDQDSVCSKDLTGCTLVIFLYKSERDCEWSQTWFLTSKQPFWSQGDGKFFAHACSSSGYVAVSNHCFQWLIGDWIMGVKHWQWTLS